MRRHVAALALRSLGAIVAGVGTYLLYSQGLISYRGGAIGLRWGLPLVALGLGIVYFSRRFARCLTH
jgi:hypothetical protein